MSAITSAQLVAGVVTSIAPPNPAMNTARVVIQNLSSFDVTVINTGADSNLAPYTQDVYDTQKQGTPLQLVPANNSMAPAGLPAYVIATWYAPNEAPQDASYPAAISPPAFALGLAIAEQLLAAGVPPVLVSKTLVATRVLNSGGVIAGVDITSVSEIVITGRQTPVTADIDLFIEQRDPAGAVVVDRQNFAFPGNAGVPYVGRLAAGGGWLEIVNNSAADLAQLTVIGTNRQPLARFDTRNLDAGVDRWNANAAVVAGTDLPLVQSPAGPLLQGQVFATFAAGGTVSGGLFRLDASDGNSHYLAGTTEFYTQAGSTVRRLHRMIGVPPGGYSLIFEPTVADATARNYTVTMVPAGL